MPITLKELKHISGGYYKNLKQSMDEMDSEKNAEAIHAFRVEYKKLRAFYRLLSSVPSVPSKISMSSKLKELYAACGGIRDLQNQQERVKEIAGDQGLTEKEYLKTLKKTIRKRSAGLKKLLLKTASSSGKIKAFRQFPKELMPDDLRRFVVQQWSAITVLVSRRRIEDVHLHEIRKRLKDVYYSFRVYDGGQYQSLEKELLKKDEQSLVALLDGLGSFQDLNVSLSCLDTYWLNNFDLKEHQLLFRVQYKWLKDHSSAHRRLLKEVKKLLSASQAPANADSSVVGDD